MIQEFPCGFDGVTWTNKIAIDLSQVAAIEPADPVEHGTVRIWLAGIPVPAFVHVTDWDRFLKDWRAARSKV